MRRPILAALVLCSIAPPAHAASQPKPGLKVYGFSVNTVFIDKGTTVPPQDSTNACYRIGGASGAPDHLQGTVFVRAIGIPRTAKTHYVFHTPWDKDPAAEDPVFDGPFKNALFRSKSSNLGGAVGGPVGRHDYYTYRQLPSGTPASYYMSGTYSFSVTAKAGGKTYSAKGKITLQCA